MVKAHTAFSQPPGGVADAKTRMWLMRNILTFASIEGFDFWREYLLPLYEEVRPVNSEGKFLIRARSGPGGRINPDAGD